jgi:hypothetical protein
MSHRFPQAPFSLWLDHVTQYELEGLWIKSALPTVQYRFGAEVRATSGEYIGKTGRVVALLSLEPHPLYVIEEPEGTSFNATQPELERV